MSNNAQPFPMVRPGITITKSNTQPFTVDSKEMRYWFAIPEVGKRTLWSIYDQPGWNLTTVSEMEAVCEAQIHDIDCVEVVENDWYPDKGWEYGTWTIYGRITDDEIQWIATCHIENGKKIFKSYLDDDFSKDWGNCKRIIVKSNLLREIKEDMFEFDGNNLCTTFAGYYDVKIGDKTFTCMKVIESPKIADDGTLVEAYIDKSGRTLLFRRYNGLEWNKKYYKETWDKKLPDSKRIIINGIKFVHWYDCTSDLTL